MLNDYCLLFSFFLIMTSWTINLQAEEALPPEMQNLYLEYQDHLALFKKQGSLSLDDQLFLIHQIHTNIIDINKRKKEFYAEFLNHHWSKATSEKDHQELKRLIDSSKAETLLPEINFYKGIIFFSYESRKGSELFDIVTMMTEIDFEKGVANFAIYTIPRENSGNNKTVSLFSISDAHAGFDTPKSLIDHLKSNKVVEKKALPRKVEFALDLFKVGAPIVTTMMTFSMGMSGLLIPLLSANPPLAAVLGVGIAGVLGTVGVAASTYVGYHTISKYRQRSQNAANRFQNLHKMCSDELIDFHRRLGTKLLGYDYQLDFKMDKLNGADACDVINANSKVKADQKKGEQAQTCVECQKKDEKKISYEPGILFYASLVKDHDFRDRVGIRKFGISIAESRDTISGFLNKNRKDIFKYISEDSMTLYNMNVRKDIDRCLNDEYLVAEKASPITFSSAFNKVVRGIRQVFNMDKNKSKNINSTFEKQAKDSCEQYRLYKICTDSFHKIVGLAKECRPEYYKHYFYEKI